MQWFNVSQYVAIKTKIPSIIKGTSVSEMLKWKKVWNQWNLILKNNHCIIENKFPMLLINIWYIKKAYQLKVGFFMT